MLIDFMFGVSIAINLCYILIFETSSFSFVLLFTFRSCVRIVTSQRCAMGKSLYINRLGEDLRAKLGNSRGCVHVTIPLHGPVVTSDTLLEFLQDHMKNPSCCIYHIDIASSVRRKMLIFYTLGAMVEIVYFLMVNLFVGTEGSGHSSI